MLKSRITLRLASSFLLVVLASLTLLGAYLLNYFHDHTIERERDSLILNARIVEMTLADQLYPANDGLAAVIQNISQATALRITILDENGTVLADTAEPADQLDNHLLRDEVQQAMNHEYGTAIRYSQTLKENRMYVAVPVYQEGRLAGIIRTSTSLSSLEQSYDVIVRAIGFALMLALLTALIISLWLARRQVRPIQRMSAAARAIAAGDLERRIQWHSGDEFDILAQTINKLTANLAEKIKEARAETHKLSLILENMDNGVMLINARGDITGMNRQAQQSFQLRPEQLQRHSIHVIGSAQLSQGAQQVLRDNFAQTISFRTELPGKIRTFQVFLAPFPDTCEETVLAVFHDISLLEEINRRQTEFVGNAAHELATPLTSISGFAETLMDDDFSHPDDSRHFAAVIYRESQRMSRLIHDLLQLARLDSSDYRQQIPRTAVDASAVLLAAEAPLRRQAAAKSQTITLDLPDTAPKIKAAPDLLEQILRNLTENAIKYTPEQGTITLRCTADDKAVRYQISDTGIGIAAGDLPRIFDRFYRVDKARTRQSGGNGIGLSLVKFLVNLFDGTITVKSTPGQGTTFILAFPRIAENPDE